MSLEPVGVNHVSSSWSVSCLLQPVKYPKVVFFIISNEFCERFSYYGMRSKSTSTHTGLSLVR